MTQERALALANLYIKVKDETKLRSILSWLADHLPDLSDGQMGQFLRLAGSAGHADLVARGISQAGTRMLIELTLAMALFRLAIEMEDKSLAVEMKSALGDRVAPTFEAQFRIEASLLLDGPHKALELARSLRKRATSPEAAVQSAQLLIDTGQARLASRYLRLCARRWPAAPRIALVLVRSFVQAGDPDGGLHWLEANEHRLPAKNVPDLRRTLLIAQGQIDEAMKLLESEIEAGQRPAGDTLLLQIYCSKGCLKEAEEVAAALRNDPRFPKRKGAHFGISVPGVALNELRLYNLVRGSHSGALPDPSLTETNLHAASVVLDQWTSRDASQVVRADSLSRNIFQYWNTSTRPPELAQIMQTWQNVPGWTYSCLDKPTAKKWLGDTFGATHARAFVLARHVAEESDFFRLCRLYHSGGIYADADDMLTGDPNDLIGDGQKLIVYREPLGMLANNVIIAPPGHAAIGRAIDMAMAALLARDNDSIWSKTGPGLLTRAVAAHVQAAPEDAATDTIVLPQYRLHRNVHPHMKLPYKNTSRYWNSQAVRQQDAVSLALQAVLDVPKMKIPTFS